MKELKSKKGITLVALVVTIIILIILAGISISILTGEDGLIAKAKQAKENMELAEQEEQGQLNTLYDRLATGTGPATTYDSIAEYQQQIIELQTKVNNGTVTADKMLKDYTAYKNGEYITGTINNYSGNPEKITLTAEQIGETTIDISDGYYTEIQVDASEVYDKGVTDGKTQAAIYGIAYNGNWSGPVKSIPREYNGIGINGDSFVISTAGNYLIYYNGYSHKLYKNGNIVHSNGGSVELNLNVGDEIYAYAPDDSAYYYEFILMTIIKK